MTLEQQLKTKKILDSSEPSHQRI